MEKTAAVEINPVHVNRFMIALLAVFAAGLTGYFAGFVAESETVSAVSGIAAVAIMFIMMVVGFLHVIVTPLPTEK